METWLEKGRNTHRGLHGSYLQGMETKRMLKDGITRNKHGSYLQGMETHTRKPASNNRAACTDPTYKEWKLGQGDDLTDFVALEGTDPTYKEWKPCF